MALIIIHKKYIGSHANTWKNKRVGGAAARAIHYFFFFVNNTHNKPIKKNIIWYIRRAYLVLLEDLLDGMGGMDG